MFKRFSSLRARLIVAFLLITLLVAGVGLYQFRSIANVHGLFGDLTGNDFERRSLLHDMRVAEQEIEIVVLRHNPAAELSANPSNGQAQITERAKTLDDLLTTYQDRLKADTEHSINESIVTTLRTNADAVIQAAAAFIEAASKNGSAVQLAEKRAELDKKSTEFKQNLGDITRIELALTSRENNEVEDATIRLERISIFLIASVVLLSALLGILMTYTLTGSLRRLKQGAQRLANGDFSRQIPVTSHDEIGETAQAFNTMAERLRESYHRLSVETERDRVLLESMGEGVLAVDEKGAIVIVNTQAGQLLELEETEKLTGRAVHEVVTLLDTKDKPLPDAQLPIMQALETRQAVHDIYAFRKSGGVKVALDITATPVLVESRTVGAIMNLRDVTKEKEIDRMKTEFISLASHQLRTPLSAIRWFSEMLLSGDAGELKPDQAEFARNISDSTDRMIALVNALLNISRIESGRIMIDPKPTDLRELVSGIVNDLKAKTSEKEQMLIISVHEDLPKINLDPRLIGQVYLNLLTNAIKYTPKGGEISVFISKKGDEVISQVTDNGYGIPKEQQGRIFQKFFRASNAAKVETDGTGLGLYLIKAVVESSGGKIWFESEEGKGTTFWFSMPLSGMKPKEGEVTLDA